jgi:phosphoserine phosphatase
VGAGGRIELVVFDCDSTLCAVEGVDELARRAGAHDVVADLTRRAMAGEVPLNDAYMRRLDLIRPERAALEWLAQEYLRTLVPGAAEAVAALAGEGREVHIVSGGLRPAVGAVGDHLGLPADRVHAVDIDFSEDGAYAGADAASPLARAGGKTEVLRALGADRRRAVMIGDGATDLEAAAAGAVVIGFGGVEIRPMVRERADHFLAGPSLLPVVDLIRSLDG